MVYIIVLLGSCSIIGIYIVSQQYVRKRAVRSFVRGVTSRMEKAHERGEYIHNPIKEVRKKSARTTAVAVQEVRTILKKIDHAMRQKDFPLVERLYIQALTVKPDAYDIQASLAKLYLQTGREHKAEALYREVVEYCQDPTYLANLGLTYYQLQKFDLAADAYAHALAKDTQSPERELDLARALFACGEYEKAVTHLEKASIRLWRDTELLSMLAEAYEQLQKRDLALDSYKKINRVQPYNQDVKEKIALLQTQVG